MQQLSIGSSDHETGSCRQYKLLASGHEASTCYAKLLEHGEICVSRREDLNRHFAIIDYHDVSGDVTRCDVAGLHETSGLHCSIAVGTETIDSFEV